MKRWKCAAIAMGLMVLAGFFQPARALGDETLDPVLLAQWLGLDPNDPVAMLSDPDYDGLATYRELTSIPDSDPLERDSDGDGLDDRYGVTAAYVPFLARWKFQDELWHFFPAWLDAVTIGGGGAWTAEAWHLPAETPENEGAADFHLDRAGLGTNDALRMSLVLVDNPGSLRVDLLDANGAPAQAGEDVLLDVVGNLEEGTGETIELEMGFDLRQFPDVTTISLRRESGAMTLYSARLCALSPEALSVVSDTASVQGGAAAPGATQAAPTAKAASASGATTAKSSARSTVKSASSASGGSTSLRVSAVAGRLSGGAFVITRQTIAAGGTRQVANGGVYIMEDTFGESTPGGWSSGGNFRLHAGYQQAEDFYPVPAIRNLSPIGTPFNPSLGEKTTISYVLSGYGEDVDVEVVKGGVGYPVLLNAAQGAGLHTVTWDGLSGGNPLGNGAGTIRVTVTNRTATGVGTATANAGVSIAGNKRVISAVSESDEPTFTHGSGLDSTYIDFTLTTAVGDPTPDTDITLTDIAGAPVNAWTIAGVGAKTQPWDGQNTAGNYVPDGLYLYTIESGTGNGALVANPVSGAIIVVGGSAPDALTETATSADSKVVVYHNDDSTLSIAPAVGGALNDAMWALRTTTGLILESAIYEITAAPALTGPAVMRFAYDPALVGRIDGKLQLYKYDTVTGWLPVADQFIDYQNGQVVAKVTNFSLYALMTGEMLGANALDVRIEPETLKINDGVLTAHVTLPTGYPAVLVTAVACEGAQAESWTVNDDGQGFVAQFRRTAVEAALAARGETLDTTFAVECTWTSGAISVPLSGSDTIQRVEP